METFRCSACLCNPVCSAICRSENSPYSYRNSGIFICEKIPYKAISCSACLTIQFAPPFVVRRIVPFCPTAVPLFASVKDTPQRVLSLFRLFVNPVYPSVRCTKNCSRYPTAVPVFASVKHTPWREL